jgi:hypothetical protein
MLISPNLRLSSFVTTLHHCCLSTQNRLSSSYICLWFCSKDLCLKSGIHHLSNIDSYEITIIIIIRYMYAYILVLLHHCIYDEACLIMVLYAMGNTSSHHMYGVIYFCAFGSFLPETERSNQSSSHILPLPCTYAF